MTNGFKLQFDDGLSDSGLFFFMTWRNERLICNCIVLQTISQLFLLLRARDFQSCNDYGIQPSLSS